MKTLKFFTVCFFMLLTSSIFAQLTATNDKPTFPPHEINQVQIQLVDGMVSFVESVRPFYAKGDTYQQFKLKVIIGNSGEIARTALPTLPPEGEEMLKKAYSYLSNGYTSAQIAKADDGKTIGQALIFMHEYQEKNSKSSISPDVALFGGNQNILDNNPVVKASKRKCKWYNVFCHAENFINWVSNNSTAIITTAETIAAIIAML